MKLKILAAVLIPAFLSGCLSFGVEDKNSIAVTGADISNSTSQIIDEAMISMASSDSSALVVSKLTPELKQMPNYSDENMIKRLNDSNEPLIANSVTALQLKESLSAVNAYFYGLQELVNDPTAERNAVAVANLADQVNGLNGALQKSGSGEPVLSNEKKNALVNLTKIISDQIHARKVKQAIKRDAEVIAIALYLQEQILNISEKNIFRDLTSMTNRFYVVKVEEPYEKQNSEMNDVWVANRTLYLISQAKIKELEARQSNRNDEMLQINLWSSALNGQYDSSIVSQQIKDIKEILSLKSAIKEAAKK